jgi:hypothetical protein
VTFPDFPVLQFNYRVVQLNQLDWRAYLTSTNPLAAALMARMRIAPADRWRVKLACLRLLAGLRVQGQQQRLLSQFVDLYLPLKSGEQQQFQQELATLPLQESEAVMEIVTSWELKGRAEGLVEGEIKGRAEGRAEGTRDLVVRQLRWKLGDLTAVQEDQIAALTPSQLEDLAKALLNFTSAADLDGWLATLGEA